jgi:hypothetical protein
MIIRAAVPAALYFGCVDGSGWDMRLLPQFHIQSFSIEEVIGVERNDLSFRRDEVNAGSLYRRDAEVVFV